GSESAAPRPTTRESEEGMQQPLCPTALCMTNPVPQALPWPEPGASRPGDRSCDSRCNVLEIQLPWHFEQGRPTPGITGRAQRHQENTDQLSCARSGASRCSAACGAVTIRSHETWPAG